MSLNAVETYVKSVLNGLTTPGIPDAAEAWVMPPAVVQTTTPQLFVWGGSLSEARLTLPRASTRMPVGGQKRTAHKVTVWVFWSSSNDPAEAELFPVLLDLVLARMRAIELPVDLTDAVTGAKSVLQVIGEEMTLKHVAPVAAAPQLMLYNTAEITLPAVEVFVA